MKKYTKETVEKILENHRQYLLKDTDDWRKMRANFHNADLSGFDFSNMDLRGANFDRANLTGVKFIGANLADTYFKEANLSGADLTAAQLVSADFQYSNLSGTKFNGASLRDACLKGVQFNKATMHETIAVNSDFSYSNFRDASVNDSWFYDCYFIGTIFSCASLTNTDFCRPSFQFSNIDLAFDSPHISMACPTHGSFIGWKKVAGDFIVKLEIPEDARRSSAGRNKCRCDKAKVLEIQTREGVTVNSTLAVSIYDPKFVYTPGEMVSVPVFNDDRFNECSTGIHFFIDRQDAVNYDFN